MQNTLDSCSTFANGFFWVEISLELLQFHRQKATFEENLNARRQDQDLKYSANVITGKSSFNHRKHIRLSVL